MSSLDERPADERLESRLAASTKLVDLTAALAAEQDLDTVLQVVTDRVRDALSGERATLYVYDDRTDELFTRIATVLEVEEIRFPAAAGVAGWVAQNRETVNIPEAAADERWSAEFDRRTGFRTRSILAAPVVSNHDRHLLGVLQVLNRKGRPFDEFESRLIEAFAAHAAAAIERAQLVAEARRSQELRLLLQIGHEIQSGFQPKEIPKFDGYEIAQWWEPAESLGGDYYDVLRLPDGRLGLVIGDVSGHGFGPSLIMATVRAMLHVLARTFSEPESILSLVSETITKDLQDGRFITMATFAVDTEHHSVTYANAGHGPIMLFRAGGDVLDLPSTALPMGFVEDHVVPTGQLLQMEPGDVLALPTDGVIELRNDDDELFGRHRLVEVIQSSRGESAWQILDNVRCALHDFQSNSNDQDDVTLVIVTRRD